MRNYTIAYKAFGIAAICMTVASFLSYTQGNTVSGEASIANAVILFILAWIFKKKVDEYEDKEFENVHVNENRTYERTDFTDNTEAFEKNTSEEKEVKRLYRSATDRKICGVCGGIAEYLNVDSTIVRLFALFFAFSGSGLFLYFITALVMKEGPVSYRN